MTRKSCIAAAAAAALLIGLATAPATGLAQSSGQASESQPGDPKVKAILDSLHWVTSGRQAIDRVAALEVPEGYLFLNPTDTVKLMELMQNPTSPGDQIYYFGPQNNHWFAILRYLPVGHVPDNEKIDADAILKSIKEGTEHSNVERRQRGWPELHTLGWQYPPRYNPTTRHLEWATLSESAGEQVVNFNTRVLGREGVTSIVLVASPEGLEQNVGEFRSMLANFEYVDGQRYAEFKQGDKVAEYGLAALITGGAAAVAVKSGAAKWLWKVLGLGGIAALAGLRRLFGGGKG